MSIVLLQPVVDPGRFRRALYRYLAGPYVWPVLRRYLSGSHGLSDAVRAAGQQRNTPRVAFRLSRF